MTGRAVTIAAGIGMSGQGDRDGRGDGKFGRSRRMMWCRLQEHNLLFAAVRVYPFTPWRSRLIPFHRFAFVR